MPERNIKPARSEFDMQRQKAFTLTELIVALGLGAVILLVVTMSLNTATRSINRTTSQVGLHNRGYATMSRMLDELENVVPGVMNNTIGTTPAPEPITHIRYIEQDTFRLLIFLTSKSNLDSNFDGTASETGEPRHDLVWVRYLWNADEDDESVEPPDGKYNYLMRREVPAHKPEYEASLLTGNPINPYLDKDTLCYFLANPIDFYGDMSGDLSAGDSYLDGNGNVKFYYPYNDAVTEYAFDRNVTDFKVFFDNNDTHDGTVHDEFNVEDNDDPWPQTINVRYKLYDPRTESEKEFGFTANIPGFNPNP